MYTYEDIIMAARGERNKNGAERAVQRTDEKVTRLFAV